MAVVTKTRPADGDLRAPAAFLPTRPATISVQDIKADSWLSDRYHLLSATHGEVERNLVTVHDG